MLPSVTPGTESCETVLLTLGREKIESLFFLYFIVNDCFSANQNSLNKNYCQEREKFIRRTWDRKRDHLNELKDAKVWEKGSFDPIWNQCDNFFGNEWPRHNQPWREVKLTMKIFFWKPQLASAFDKLSFGEEECCYLAGLFRDLFLAVKKHHLSG